MPLLCDTWNDMILNKCLCGALIYCCFCCLSGQKLDCSFMFVHLTTLTPKLPALVLCMPPSADVWCFAFAVFATGSCWRMSWSAWRCLRGFSGRGIHTWRWWVCRTLSSGGRYRSARWAPLWFLPTKAKLRRKRKKRRTKTDLWIWCVVYRSSRDYWVPRFTSYKRTRRRKRKR